MDTHERSPLPDGHESNDANSKRFANALSSSGLSITLTSLCSAIAFFAGSSVNIPAAHSFCIYAAWSFLANDILQFLVFVPLMVMDNGRIRSKRNLCFCRINEEEVDQMVEEMRRDVPANSTDSINTSIESPNIEHIEQSAERDSFLSRVLLPVISNRISRLLIIALFLGALCGSISVIPLISTESDVSKYVPDDSMVLDFVHRRDEAFGSRVNEMDIVIKNLDFSDPAIRVSVYDLIADLESQDDALDAVDHWLDEFGFFLNGTALEMDTMDSNTFYSELQSFSNGTRWESEIVYDDPLNPTKIKSTRFKLSVKGDTNLQANYPEYLEWNELFHSHFPSASSGFIFYEFCMIGYFQTVILSMTFSNMIFAGIGVLSVLIIFVDLRLALFMILIVSMINVHLMAWMWALGIALDSVSFICLVMAVGLTVDYVIHITHSIGEAQPDGDTLKMSDHEIYSAKLRKAMNAMAVSVWYVPLQLFLSLFETKCFICPLIRSKGALTTFIGVATLAFSRSEGFRNFFKMVSGIIIIAVAHGAILTPALLGECTFILRGRGQEEDIEESQTSGQEETGDGDDRAETKSVEMTSASSPHLAQNDTGRRNSVIDDHEGK